MDVIKDMATTFSRGFRTHSLNLEMFDSQLNSKLIYINKRSEKLRYLSYLKDMLESGYQKHAKVCPNPTTCRQNKDYEIALYSVKQQYDEYYEIEGGLNTLERPAMNFFSEGQYFDAFTSIKECIKEANQSIILVDSYINADTLAFFPGKQPSIKLRLITKDKSLNDLFKRAVDIYNRQFENLRYKSSENFHDRFLIIDDKIFYHIGASIKDAGNKTFMFSRIDDSDIHSLLRNKIQQEWPDILD